MAAFEAGSAFVTVLPSMRGFQTKIREEVAKIRPVEIKVTPKVTGIEKAREDLDRASKNVKDPVIKPKVDDKEARAKFRELQLQMSRLTAEIKAGADTTQAKLKIAELRAELLRLSSNTRDVKVRVDVQQANSQLRSLASTLNSVGNNNRGFSKISNDASNAARSIGLMTGVAGAAVGAIGAIGAGASGIISLTNALVSASGALAAIPGLAFGAAAAIGTLAVGASGMGDAFKELSKSQTASAGSSKSAAKTQVDSAAQIANAKRGVQRAEESLSRAQMQANRDAIDASRAVEDAEQAREDARKRSAQDAIASLKAIKKAQDEYKTSQEGLKKAQLDMNDAWTKGFRALQDLNNQLLRGRLDQRAATEELKGAQDDLNKTLADPTATKDQINHYTLVRDQAVQKLNEIKLANQRLSVDTAKANQKGVAGTEQVVSAQNNLKNAQDSVRTSQQGVTDAFEQQRKQQQESARSMADARRAVSDAALQQQRQIVDSQYAIAQATQGVQDANRQLAESYKKTGDAGTSAAGGTASALSKLSPEARKVVKAFQAVKAQYHGLQQAVQNKLFEGLGKEIREIGTAYLPVMRKGMIGVAGGFNLMAKNAAGFLKSKKTLGDTGLIFSNMSVFLRTATVGLRPFLRGLLNIGAVGSDFLPRLGVWLAKLAKQFEAWTDNARKTGQLNKMIEDGIQVFKDFGATVKNIGSAISGMFDHAGSKSEGFFARTRRVTEQFDKFVHSADGQNKIAAFFNTIHRVVDNLTPGIKALFSAMFSNMTGAESSLVSLSKGFSNLMIAVAPLIPLVSRLFAHFTGGVLTGITSAMNVFASVLKIIEPILRPLAGLMGTLVGSMVGLGVATKILTGPLVKLGALFKVLLPGAIAAKILNLSSGFKQLGTSAATAGAATAGTVGTATTGTGRMGKFAGAVGKVGSALGIAGVLFTAASAALDSVTTSTDEATAAFAQGGQAARDAASELIAQGATANEMQKSNNLLVKIGGKIYGAFTDDLNEAREGMNGMQLAQSYAAEAGAKWQATVDKYGQKSIEASQASKLYSAEIAKVAQKEWEAEQATKTHTQRMNEQQNAMLAQGNAQIAYQQGQTTLKEKQDALNTAIAQYGARSDEATTALLDLQSSTYQQIQAAGDLAAARNAGKGPEEQERARTAATNREVRRQVELLGKHTPQALRDMVHAMTPADAVAAGFAVTTDDLGNAIVHIPGQKNIRLTDKGDSIGKITRKVREANKSLGVLTDFINNVGQGKPLLPGRGNLGQQLHDKYGLPTNADGGYIQGKGTGTSDSIVSRLSNGEFVTNAKQTAKHLPLLHAINDGAPGFAKGGFVGMPRFASGGQAKKKKKTNEPTPAAVVAPVQNASSSLAGTVGTLTSATQVLTGSVQQLNTAGLAPLQARIASSSVPGFFQLENHAGKLAPAAVNRLKATLPVLGNQTNKTSSTIKSAWSGITTKVTQSQQTMTTRQRTLQTNMGNSWAGIRGSVQTSVSRQKVAFTSLDQGMGNVRSSIINLEQTAKSRFSAIRNHAAQPIRSTIQGPINRGLIAAWNSINSQFSLGKKVNMVPVGFATGGHVRGPGSGTSDDIPAMLSNNEFVVKSRVTKKALPFLKALNNEEPEALQAANIRGYKRGGLVADTGSELNAALLRGTKFAQKQSGKPYIWGGVGPAGYDCSGYMSAITNVLRNQNPHHRLGVARSQPWPGFVRGLSSAFATGFSSTHTAGTLAGTNVESTGNHVRFGGDAHGANASQFSGHASLPVVGGKFVPGSGGGSFDPTPIVNSAFKKTYDMIRNVNKQYPGNIAAHHATGMASKAADQTKAKALKKLSFSMGGPGGSAPPELKRYALSQFPKFGWGPEQLPPLDRLWTKESGWRVNADNPSSSAYGIPQSLPGSKMASAGPDWRTNPKTQINWGLGYIKGRYGSPSGAWAHSVATNWYSKGGTVPGKGNHDTEPAMLTPGERVLTTRQNRAWDTVTNVLTRRGVSIGDQSQGSDGPMEVRGVLQLENGVIAGEFKGVIVNEMNKQGDSLRRGKADGTF